MHRLKRQLAEQPALELVQMAVDPSPASAAIAAAHLESGLVEPQLEQPSLEPTALTLAPGQAMPSRYLGLMLFYPALQVVGLLELAAQVYQLAGVVRFGVPQVFTELFCLALLQEPSVERVKHVLRSDLGAVMGSGQAACVKTLRRKLDELSQQRFTVIFDRGGYDGQLFTWLVEQGLDFITYQRGEVHLDDHLFTRREVRWGGQRVRFHIAEDAVTVGESGPWRRIVIWTPGHQRPILTSLDPNAVAAARVGALMLTRWRQENFFKYARAHLGLDVLTTYAAETAVDHEVPNPAVKASTAQLKRLRTTAQKLRAALGRA